MSCNAGNVTRLLYVDKKQVAVCETKDYWNRDVRESKSTESKGFDAQGGVKILKEIEELVPIRSRTLF